MSDILLHPCKLHGSMDFLRIAPSKSCLHREMICSYLSHSPVPYGTSDDTILTYRALSDMPCPDRIIDAGESASTLRFLIPLAIYMGGRTFRMGDRLKKRPLTEYSCINTADIRLVGENMLYAGGSISSGEFVMHGNISSQFATGLMFVLPLLHGDSRISFSQGLQSQGYADLTADILGRYGITVLKQNGSYIISGDQSFVPCDSHVTEGDWSYAAYFVTANALSADISLTGLNEASLQPDRCIEELLSCRKTDISPCPDLFPTLCVYACGQEHDTLIYNAARLRMKECDRLHAMAEELSRLGASIEEHDDSLLIHGKGHLHGGEVYSHNDHRIAMALTIAALCICEGDVYLHGCECVSKSAPDFFRHIDYLKRGVDII